VAAARAPAQCVLSAAPSASRMREEQGGKDERDHYYERRVSEIGIHSKTSERHADHGTGGHSALRSAKLWKRPSAPIQQEGHVFLQPVKPMLQISVRM
jgi:hypothetical protein